MENFELKSIYTYVKDAVNEALGKVAKDSVESSNFQTLQLIAKIGIDLNSYMDGLFNPPSNVVVDAEKDEEAAKDSDEDTAENTSGEAPQDEKVSTLPKPKNYFSVPNSVSKEWIFNYLGRRGGTANTPDLYNDYFNEYKHRMTEKEIKTNQHIKHINRRVSEMREVVDKKGNLVNPLIEPFTGKKTTYYSLSKYGMEQYKIALEKKTENSKYYVQTVLDGMSAQG